MLYVMCYIICSVFSLGWSIFLEYFFSKLTVITPTLTT